MGKHEKWVKNWVSKRIDLFPLLKEYQDLIEQYIIFHLVAIGVRYKEYGSRGIEDYLSEGYTEEGYDYHNFRNQFYSLNYRTEKMKEERQQSSESDKRTELEILNFWKELRFLIPNPDKKDDEDEKIRHKVRGQINRGNFKAIKFSDYDHYFELSTKEIENFYSSSSDELEMLLHLYMFEKAVRFQTLKHFCKVLDYYNEKHQNPKTPKEEHVKTYIEILRIPSLHITKRLLNSESFNPSDMEWIRDFRFQLNQFIMNGLKDAFNYLNYLYDTQFKYYKGKMIEENNYVNITEIKGKELKRYGLDEPQVKGKERIVTEKQVNFFGFVRTIVEEEDIDVFYNEVNEDGYHNSYSPKKENPDFSINTFNKLKLIMTGIAKQQKTIN